MPGKIVGGTRRAGPIELIAFTLCEVGALLLLASQAGRILTLAWVVALPLVAWAYARWRAPGHVFAIAGAACGLAAFPLGHALFSLIVLPFPLQLLGLLGLVAETLHGIPGTLLATLLELERQGDTSTSTLLLDYLFNGLVWAVVYGSIGSLCDRARFRQPRRR
ncbi:MAG TPA: hypothetical protein VIS76_09885 [Pseudomonadales bacterium]